MFEIVLFSWMILAVYFSLLYVIARRIGNYALVDVGWTTGFGLLASIHLSGDPGTLILCLVMMAWSFRLGLHLFFARIFRQKEEGRYRTLRHKWSGATFFFFFQAQALTVVVMCTPLWLMIREPVGLSAWIWVGLVLAIVSVVGEAIADRQLKRFLSLPKNAGLVCQDGLWRYSRHPNYFFESIIWLSFAVMALPTPYGWIGFVSPILIISSILWVTGIPPTEAQSLKTKGDRYRAYQKTTNAFFPGPRKKIKGASVSAG